MATSFSSCLSSTSSSQLTILSLSRRTTHTPRGLASFKTTPFRPQFHASISSATSSAAFPFDLSPPPIDHDDLLLPEETATTVDNDSEALDAAEEGIAVVDLSHYCRIRVSGEDRAQFLHNQSTANFECLHEGQGCDTVFVTPTARTIDIAHAWIMKTAITLVVSPDIGKSITEMLNKYIFFADKVEIEDITERTSLFVLIGPNCEQVIRNLNIDDLIGQPYGSHKHYSVNGLPVTVAVGNIISEDGFSLMMPPAAAGAIWKALLSQGAIPMGSNAWETLRVLRGRPAPGKELTNEFNVLEAGLWNSISLNKGCYKGQETISRLITYDGIKQKLWGIQLSAAADPGMVISFDGKKVGKLTSYTTARGKVEHFGLGYIKRQGASKGDVVTVGDNIVGEVVEVPYLAHQRIPLMNAKA